MADVPDGAKGPYPDGQNEEHPDSSGDREQRLLPICPQLQNTYNLASAIDEKLFLELAKSMGHEWPQIATALGMPFCEVEQIIANNPHNLSQRAFRMLVLWKRKSKGNEPVKDLKEALEFAGRCDIAKRLVEASCKSEQRRSPNEMPYREVNERQTGPFVPGEENVEESLRGFYDSTRNLRGSDLLGKSRCLPNFVAKYFDSSGGFLDIPEYDVTLMIPKGAIESGMVQEVYLHVGPQTVYLIPEAPTHGPQLGQLVTFGPPGLNFKRHVILHIPLIYEKEDAKPTDEVVKDPSPMKTTDWGYIAADKDNDVIIKERQIIVVLSSFQRHCSELKKLTVCVTTPVFSPSDECIQFRVKLWDELRYQHQKGSNEETANIEVNLECGKLDLTIIDLHPGMKSVSGDGMYISVEKLTENSMNEVSFQLHQTDENNESQGTRQNEERLCVIQIHQRSDHEAFRHVNVPVRLPKKSTGQDNSPADSPSDAEHQKEEHQPHLPKSSTERDQPDLPPNMTKWTNDEVRQWLLYIGIPGACVSKFVTAETDGDDLAEFSDGDLESNFTLSKNLREIILTSRHSWLDGTQREQSREGRHQDSGSVSTGSSHMPDTDVICNDFLIESESSTIHLNDETDTELNTIDLSVSVDVIKIPGGELSQKAVQLIVDTLQKAVQEDSFCDLVTSIGNVFNENYAELVSLEGLTCTVRFQTREGLYTFGEKCNSGDLAAKLSKILITDEIRRVVGSDLQIRLTLTDSDYVRGMKHFE